MKTFSIQTLGCKVNQYESDQIAALLRARGLVQVDSPHADLRVVNSCSVTVQAASKSRQTIRRTTRLPVLDAPAAACGLASSNAKTIVTGCWATSNPVEAAAIQGVDAIIGHHDDVEAELTRLLNQWSESVGPQNTIRREPPPGRMRDDGSIISAGTPAENLATHSKPFHADSVKQNLVGGVGDPARTASATPSTIGTRSLPLLGEHQTGRQRAFLKIQDGCDAHCTYCIIPQLRPALWSKRIDDAVEESRQLVASGHKEIVLTGIFLGAYGHETALRRRQRTNARPIEQLVSALCTQVPGLRRLRFSSLEPGDLSREMIDVLRSHPEVVPHFHLPLQSGSDAILRRMNRQYTHDDFLRTIDRVRNGFDRPAITTDIIVGFPGETDREFEQTLDIVERVKFIHIHAFSFSPRPGTAAARWTSDFVRGPIVNQRIELLNSRARAHSHEFRRQFIGEEVAVMVEQLSPSPGTPGEGRREGLIRHGRCERYFDVHFDDSTARAGDLVRLRIDRVTSSRTIGAPIR